jgi:hypothetical protein
MSLIEWLLSIDRVFYESRQYSYSSRSKRFTYYYPSFTAESVKQALQSHNASAKKAIILNPLPHTYENALHLILSGFLYENDPSIHHEQSIYLHQLPIAYSYKNNPELKQEHRARLASLTILSSDSSDNSDEDDGLVSTPWLRRNSIPEIGTEELVAYQDNHKKLNPLSVLARMEQEVKTIITIILKILKDDKESLFTLLTTQSYEDLNTPLHCAFKGALPAAVFADILLALKGKENLEEIALKPDSDGRTIFHYMSSKIGGFYSEIFGVGILQAGFTTIDGLGYTPLHMICGDNTPHKLQDLTIICDFIKLILVTPNSPCFRPFCKTDKIQNRLYGDSEIIQKLFQCNMNGHNPLHLVCFQSKPVDAQVITLFQQTLGIDKYYQTLTKPDTRGNLPSHYAIAGRNLDVVKSMLANLKPDQMKAIFLMVNTKNENGLMCATLYGTTEIFDYVVQIIGYDTLYECRQACPSLKTKAQKNKNIMGIFTDTIKKYNALYDCVDYFLQNKSKYTAFDLSYLKQLHDFIACIKHIHTDKPYLPPEHPDFQSTGWLGLFRNCETYHDYRKYLKVGEEMKKQLAACTEYFQKITVDNEARAVINSIFDIATPKLQPVKKLSGDEDHLNNFQLPAAATRC